MGLWNKIAAKINKRGITAPAAKQGLKQIVTYSPAFSTWSGGIYESELVRAAIHSIATHTSKLSVRFDGSAKKRTVSALRHAPNGWQTWSQFLYQLRTILEVRNTAYILPIFDEYGEIVGLCPANPMRCTIKKYDNDFYLSYQFTNGVTSTIELDRCGVLTKFQYNDDLCGASNSALSPTMDLIKIQTQGIIEAVKSSATYRFIAKVTNFSLPEDLARVRRDFNETNFRGEADGGVLLFPNTFSDISQITQKSFVVDAEQMKIIQDNVSNYFGVNLKIMQNAANSTELDAFFNGAIEPFSIQLSEVLSRMIYSNRELSERNFAHVTANRLQYMSVSEKVQLSKELGDRGCIMIDEIRELFNFAPLPDGKGQFAPIRGEYYNVIKEDEE